MMRMQLRGITVFATLALGLVAGAANAYVPPAEDHEVPLPYQQGSLVYGNEVGSFASPRVATSIADQMGGRWSVYSWNRQAGSAHYVIGSGADVAPPFSGVADAELAARYVLDQNSTTLNVNPGQLRLDSVTEGAGKYAVHFQQTYEGLDVIGGRAHATFLNTGRVFVMGADYYRIEGLSTTPGLSQSEAEAIAIDDLPHQQRSVSAEVGEETGLYVLPYPTSLDTFEPRLVWMVTVETDGRTGVFETYLDANTGEILWRHNDVHYVNYLGVTEGGVQDGTYCNGEATQRLKYMEVAIAGVGTTNSNGNGDWVIPNGDSTPRNATSRFYGPYVDVNRNGGGDASQSVLATPGVPLTISWTDGNARQDERDVFDSVSDIHDWFETFDPGFAYSNARITANVGVPGTCNAFWNGTINFYNAGGGCANTGEIQGVVHHEFGHGVQNSILGSQGGEGLGEGNSDILANFLTDESIIGRGFQLNCSAGIRNSDNAMQYPENLTGQVHNDGQIIAGVMWHARENLEATLGAGPGEFRAAQIWHFGRKLEHPFNQPDQVLSMFIADDDNGNLDDGTPNYDAICAAVLAHDTDGDGFECPPIITGVFIVHTPLTTPQPEGDAVLTATVTTTIVGAFILPSSVEVHYSINGSLETAVVMTPSGPDQYTTTLAGLTEPTEAEYYITAEDNLGNTGSSPRTAPLEKHMFDIPTVWDDIETDTGWTVNLEGTDNAATGAWVRVDPVPTSAQPDDDHTPAPGVICWITGQHTAGQGDGFNDIDSGTTTLYSPVYDLSGSIGAKVKYHRWYSNDRGATPNTDIWVVQARNNGGAWVDIERNQDDQNTWFLVSAELVPLLGTLGDVQFKFVASDLGEGSLVEAGVDDFEILATGSSTDAPETASSTPRFAFHGARPNPVQGASVIAFQVPATTRVELALYDVAGRMVKSLANGSFEAGQHDIRWDGRDSNGNEVGSGVYFVRMNAGEFHATRSFVVTR